MAKLNPMARNGIPICKCKTEYRAQELESLLNNNAKFGIGVSVGGPDNRDIVLNQAEAEKPYSASIVKLIRNLAKAYNVLINKISV